MEKGIELSSEPEQRKLRRRRRVYLFELGKAHKGKVSNFFFMPKTSLKRRKIEKQVIRDCIKGMSLETIKSAHTKGAS